MICFDAGTEQSGARSVVTPNSAFRMQEPIEHRNRPVTLCDTRGHINAGKANSQVRDTNRAMMGSRFMRMTAATVVALALLGQPLAVQAQSAAGTKITSSSYRVNPGDQLSIYVWGDERLQRQLTVLPDGTFAFPLAGTVIAAGHTPNEIEDSLSKLLAPQYKGVPQQVTVSVMAPAGMQYSVIGKVKSPGNYTPTRYVNVLNAIAAAGGTSDFADLAGIVILRPSGGRNQVIRTHLSNIIKGKPSAGDLDPASVPLIQAGDTVIVP